MIYFVGAGLSVDAGVPGIAGLQAKLHDKLRRDPMHGAAYRASLQEMGVGASRDSELLGGIASQQEPGTGETADFQLEELIDVLNSSESLPDIPPEDKWGLRRAVMGMIGEGLNLDGANSGPPEHYVRLIRRAIRRHRPVHVFSVNFDLCIELLMLLGYVVETGFAGYGPQYRWEWIRFRGPWARKCSSTRCTDR